MATTRTRKRPALERVLTASDRLFYEVGIHATGVDRIAAEASVSKATLYTLRTECGPDTAVHRVNLEHRTWVHQLFGDLLAETGVTDHDLVALQLRLLYDGAMSSAQAEPHVAWAEAAKRTAKTIIEAELLPLVSRADGEMRSSGNPST